MHACINRMNQPRRQTEAQLKWAQFQQNRRNNTNRCGDAAAVDVQPHQPEATTTTTMYNQPIRSLSNCDDDDDASYSSATVTTHDPENRWDIATGAANSSFSSIRLHEQQKQRNSYTSTTSAGNDDNDATTAIPTATRTTHWSGIWRQNPPCLRRTRDYLQVSQRSYEQRRMEIVQYGFSSSQQQDSLSWTVSKTGSTAMSSSSSFHVRGTKLVAGTNRTIHDNELESSIPTRDRVSWPRFEWDVSTLHDGSSSSMILSPNNSVHSYNNNDTQSCGGWGRSKGRRPSTAVRNPVVVTAENAPLDRSATWMLHLPKKEKKQSRPQLCTTKTNLSAAERRTAIAADATNVACPTSYHNDDHHHPDSDNNVHGAHTLNTETPTPKQPSSRLSTSLSPLSSPLGVPSTPPTRSLATESLVEQHDNDDDDDRHHDEWTIFVDSMPSVPVMPHSRDRPILRSPLPQQRDEKQNRHGSNSPAAANPEESLILPVVTYDSYDNSDDNNEGLNESSIANDGGFSSLLVLDTSFALNVSAISSAPLDQFGNCAFDQICHVSTTTVELPELEFTGEEGGECNHSIEALQSYTLEATPFEAPTLNGVEQSTETRERNQCTIHRTETVNILLHSEMGHCQHKDSKQWKKSTRDHPSRRDDCFQSKSSGCGLSSDRNNNAAIRHWGSTVGAFNVQWEKRVML